MAETHDQLELSGHSIVPVATREGSVRRWRCLDCGTEAGDAESYVDADCTGGR